MECYTNGRTGDGAALLAGKDVQAVLAHCPVTSSPHDVTGPSIHQRRDKAMPGIKTKRFVVTETRRDGGVMHFRFDNEHVAREQMAGLRSHHQGRTYELTKEES